MQRVNELISNLPEGANIFIHRMVDTYRMDILQNGHVAAHWVSPRYGTEVVQTKNEVQIPLTKKEAKCAIEAMIVSYYTNRAYDKTGKLVRWTAVCQQSIKPVFDAELEDLQATQYDMSHQGAF